jgi:hypothetical protein
MGWTSCQNWQNKKQIVNELMNDYQRSGFKILGQKTTNEGLWLVVQKENVKPFISFDLIKKEKGQFFVKSLSEDCGPFYYSCPIKFFELAPEAVSKSALEWREKVKKINEKKAIQLTEGMEFFLYGNKYKVTSIYNLGKGKNYIIQDENDRRYRLKRTQIKDIELTGEKNG